jgi:pentatricopeptide repeat protein
VCCGEHVVCVCNVVVRTCVKRGHVGEAVGVCCVVGVGVGCSTLVESVRGV